MLGLESLALESEPEESELVDFESGDDDDDDDDDDFDRLSFL